ncbi:MAG TPA: diheme cytochrome c [Candidatus Dormibacteraeota bacterium]|nr:diheme cytochrome c [Candidatus Dormibacteraeota bacterium]
MRTGLAPAFLLLLVLCAAIPALGGTANRAPADPTYLAECASCHIAYPPRFLPAVSWRALMGNLGDHFGSDASLDAQTVATILQYLEANARQPRASDNPTPLRITETRWFRHEHGTRDALLGKHPAIKSAANCGACHPHAGDGRFGSVHSPLGEGQGEGMKTNSTVVR